MSARRATLPRLDRTIERQNNKGVTNGQNVKLRKMANRFEGFEEELTLARQNRKDELEKRLVHLQKQIDDSKASIALEAKNRSMSMNAVQSWLSDRIDKWTLDVQVPILAKIKGVNERIDLLNQRMDTVEEQHAQDRIDFPRLIDERCNQLLVEIRDMRTVMEINIKQREEKEQKIMVKIQNSHDDQMTMFRAEKAVVDKKFMNVNKDITSEVHTRAKGYEVVKKTVFDNNEFIKAAVDKEVQERMRSNEEVLQALAHYTSALQDGVKIVGL